MVGGVEKWEDRKWWEDRKDFIFSLFFLFDWEWKSGGKEKMSLNKFTHIPLLKNDAQLKQKKVTNNQKKKNRNHPNLFKKIENGGRIEKILFSLFFCLIGSGKVEG